MLAAHPYETPAWDVVALADAGTATTGAGRVGDVEPTTLERVRRSTSREPCRRPPAGSWSRATPSAPYAAWRWPGERATSCWATRSEQDVDVFVTSDLRHHPATEFVEKGGPALVDVSHWAAEWTWLPQVEARLAEALDTVETRVSTLCTDAWTFRA